VNYDFATELLVYAHGTPDIKVALAEIKLISERTTGASDLEIAYDDASTWPLIWYLRDYRNTRFYGTEPTAAAMASPVIIVGPKNADKVWPYVARGYLRRDYGLIWWPIQDYASVRWADLGRMLTEAGPRQRLWQFLFHRRLSGIESSSWPHRQTFTMYVNRNVARQVWSLTPPVEGIPPTAATPIPLVAGLSADVYTGPYAGRPLRAPTALAIAPDGTRLIADSGNDRIVVLNRDGTFRLTFGSRCALTRLPPEGCIDPDGDGPLERGDGQFHEPWGVAADATGEIYVADTWNGRIQVFDAEGTFKSEFGNIGTPLAMCMTRGATQYLFISHAGDEDGFLRRWGHFGQPTSADPEAAPLVLYGPRALAMDGAGSLLVADTGNKRILRFSPRGEPMHLVGGAGSIPGRFSEPVGVAIGADRIRSVYVADTWNRRIQKLDQSLTPVDQWSVPGWEGQRALNKPYLAVSDAGTVYASDPERSRILLFDAEGRLAAAVTLGTLGAGTASLPLGLAVDPAQGLLLVADHANDRVLVLRLEAPQ
jgi:DNA-binding beta-propeller fold protein YncE